MTREQLFASFLLDTEQGLEIALRAEQVAEATPVADRIQRLPASIDFVEGIMHLREDVIPLINMKKRLGLPNHEYCAEAKVAVVRYHQRRYGLMVDDIREVFSASRDDVEPVDSLLQTEDRIISSLIKRERGVRTVELLDLANLFHGVGATPVVEQFEEQQRPPAVDKVYHRYVIFSFGEQLYGVPVKATQEITFFSSVEQMYRGGVEEQRPAYSSAIKDIFKHGDIDGILTLRGRYIPVLSARRLLNGGGLTDEEYLGEDTRILILAEDGYKVGMVVEAVKSILSVPEDQIMSTGRSGRSSVSGIYTANEDENIMLLDIEYLVRDRIDELQALARLTSDSVEEAEEQRRLINSHHLITENCYLVFSIGKLMAVQLKDIQEIIERSGVMGIPGETGFSSGVINLRGQVVPVVNLRAFFGFTASVPSGGEQKLIICRTRSQVIALEVDSVVTIYKQEKYQKATALKPELAQKADTLDRLIVYDGGTAKNEHVLVVNVHNLIRNHLDMEPD